MWIVRPPVCRKRQFRMNSASPPIIKVEPTPLSGCSGWGTIRKKSNWPGTRKRLPRKRIDASASWVQTRRKPRHFSAAAGVCCSGLMRWSASCLTIYKLLIGSTCIWASKSQSIVNLYCITTNHRMPHFGLERFYFSLLASLWSV